MSKEIKVQLNQNNNPTVRSALLLAPVETTRELKLPRLKRWYSEEELDELMQAGRTGPAADRFKPLLEKEAKRQRRKKKHFFFTELEDAFIRANYMYLPDSVIALALNMPYQKVLQRRLRLGLYKGGKPSSNTMVVVWDNRKEYQKDLEKEGFMLLRNGVQHPWE